MDDLAFPNRDLANKALAICGSHRETQRYHVILLDLEWAHKITWQTWGGGGLTHNFLRMGSGWKKPQAARYQAQWRTDDGRNLRLLDDSLKVWEGLASP